jgi:hypothetical protein
MNFFTKVILILVVATITARSFTMKKEDIDSDTSYVESIAAKLSEFSKINCALAYESTLNAEIQREINEFDEVNQELIKEINTNLSSPILQEFLPKIFGALTSFVGGLEKKSSKTNIIQPYIPRYKSIIADLAILNHEAPNSPNFGSQPFEDNSYRQ